MANYIVWKNNVISMVRGDSFSNTFDLNKYLDSHILEQLSLNGGTLYFGLMYPNSHFEDSIIIKEYILEESSEDYEVTILLSPDDTELLIPGTYYYTLKLEIQDGSEPSQVYTLIPKTKFLIID